MTPFDIKRYTESDTKEWNEFLENSKQATFLFHRNYMDYHADRFDDHSLLFYRKNKLVALLPANQKDTTLHSHQGLTYGGLLTNKKATTTDVCNIFKSLADYLSSAGIETMVYKAIPHIYHRLPAEEDLYALTNICKASLLTRHVSSTLAAPHRPAFTESRKSGLRKAIRQHIFIRESNDLEAFWHILTNNLQRQYNALPVHTLSEIERLKALFPNNIRLFLAHNASGKPIGGTLIYESPCVVHTQYISASPEGKDNGAIDLLFSHLLHEVYANDARFFDFGKSSDGDGSLLNTSLIFQKEGFGARALCYDTYLWQISSTKI